MRRQSSAAAVWFLINKSILNTPVMGVHNGAARIRQRDRVSAMFGSILFLTTTIVKTSYYSTDRSVEFATGGRPHVAPILFMVHWANAKFPHKRRL